MELFFYTIELLGTVAFAVSGSMTALWKKMDMFGVCIMGVTTACAGGILRDIFLGKLPPVMFTEPVYALTAIITSLVIFYPSVRALLMKQKQLYEDILFLADSFGLGIFTAVGVSAAINAGYGNNLFFTVFLGTLTGVGGGVMRDLMAGQTPYILMKHIYALASIAGGLICVGIWNYKSQEYAFLGCWIIVTVIRALAARGHWSLPKPDDNDIA